MSTAYKKVLLTYLLGLTYIWSGMLPTSFSEALLPYSAPDQGHYLRTVAAPAHHLDESVWGVIVVCTIGKSSYIFFQ